ncbi:hypothetical protein HDV05_002561 [Chytridiales sp. JEL 0842]|nr:hypothetical protein HDV05_002561 [Chytridiales sp. JEL 0842]
MLGTSGDVNEPTACVKDGIVRDWMPIDGKPCIVRAYGGSQANGGALGNPVVTYAEDFLILLTQKDILVDKPYESYSGFRTAIEPGMHAQMHAAIGGPYWYGSHMGDPSRSVDDLAFWLHHGNVDRYWSYFQASNPQLAGKYDGETSTPAYVGVRYNVSVEDVMPGFNYKVAEGMNLGSCVKYVPYSGSTAAVPVDELNGVYYFSSSGGNNGIKMRRRVKRRRQDAGGKVVTPVVESAVGVLDKVLGVKDGLGPAVKVDAPKQSRADASPLPEEFLTQVWMKGMDIEQYKKFEARAKVVAAELRSLTDKVLLEQFGKTYSSASFKEVGVASKVAIASMSSV